MINRLHGFCCDKHNGAWIRKKMGFPHDLFFIYYEMKDGKFFHYTRKSKLDGLFDFMIGIMI